jgi:hypothetical protein
LVIISSQNKTASGQPKAVFILQAVDPLHQLIAGFTRFLLKLAECFIVFAFFVDQVIVG